jgi:uncharacterized membrane protein
MKIYAKLRENLGLSLILVIGLAVEFSNFQSLFFKFMLAYRPDWGAINHVPAAALGAFLLLCIVTFGIRGQAALSWFLALLTCLVSFAVYARMRLNWNWDEVGEIHFVVLILSFMLPLLVAYTTHQIANESDFDALAEWEEERRHREALAKISAKKPPTAQPNTQSKVTPKAFSFVGQKNDHDIPLK